MCDDGCKETSHMQAKCSHGTIYIFAASNARDFYTQMINFDVFFLSTCLSAIFI